MTFRPSPRAFAGDDFLVPFQEAIDYHRQKIDLPTKGWRDISGRAHDRAFVVAGATREALLADLRAEIDKAVAGKTTLRDFRARFEEMVARHGWTGWTGEGTAAGRAWRARVIYETNLKTAYAAGRYAQMTDPDVVKVFKWWRYRHAFYRKPARARPEHRDIFNGTILRWDDAWWDTHYPPNGWNCSCGVETLSDADLKADGLTPTAAPPNASRKVIDPGTGEAIDVPNGIDLGWDHAPGRDWSRGLMPRELQRPLEPLGPGAARSPRVAPAPAPPAPSPAPAPGADVPPMPAPRPFTAPRLAPGATPEAAAEAFLAEFGATLDAPVLFRDASGHVVPVGAEMFRSASGEWKATKRGRDREMARLAETIRDPDEIWLSWARASQTALPLLLRTYLRRDAESNGFAMFRWSAQGWAAETAFGADREAYLLGQRRGALLYRRPDERPEE